MTSIRIWLVVTAVMAAVLAAGVCTAGEPQTVDKKDAVKIAAQKKALYDSIMEKKRQMMDVQKKRLAVEQKKLELEQRALEIDHEHNQLAAEMEELERKLADLEAQSP